MEIEYAPRYVEIREQVRGRLVEEGLDPGLLDVFCVAIALLAHEQPEERLLGGIPDTLREGYEAVIDEVRVNWQDMVELVRMSTMRYIVEAVRRGVPLTAADDAVNHLLHRDFFQLDPSIDGKEERKTEDD